MTYRTFVGHDGKIHRVRMSREEIDERVRYWIGFIATCVLFGATVCIASGILG